MRIAVVDDEQKFIELMMNNIKCISEEKAITCVVDTFLQSEKFVDEYISIYDIIFLDIEMPGLNGHEVAKKIREIDQNVCIIFVTNMAQYAILGYEINALDFVVKPFEYYTFKDKFVKAVNYMKTRSEKEIILTRDSEIERVKFSEIFFMEKEKNKNYIIYNTTKGEFRERGTMGEVEDRFISYGFAKCNSGYIVNLRHVKKISGNSVLIANEILPISRQRHKYFINSLMRYLGGGA